MSTSSQLQDFRTSATFKDILQQIGQGVLEREVQHTAPYEQIEVLRSIGFGMVRLPAELGGRGISLYNLFEVAIDLAEVDPNITHSLRNHFGFVENTIIPNIGDSDSRWLKEVLAGKFFSGSSAEQSLLKAGGKEFDTTLVPHGDGTYRLNGTKYYSTGSIYADWLTMGVSSPDGSVSVIIPATRTGVEHLDDWDGIGQRLTGSGTTRLRDVVVHEDEILRHTPDGRRSSYRATFHQLWLTAVIAGILRSVLSDAVAVTKNRSRNYYHGLTDEPKDEPGLQAIIGEIAANAYVAESSVLRSALQLQDARTAPESERGRLQEEAALAAAKTKVVVDNLALQTATLVFDVGGASAIRQVAQLDRHWRNIRTLSSHNPRSYKLRAIGDYHLNGTPLPAGAFF